MRALVQRVSSGSVTVAGKRVGAIGPGLVILLGVARDDGEKDAAWVARKVANLRIFPDEEGRMNLSLLDVGGEALVVSQFTLYGDCRKGRRPSFTGAAPPPQAERLYQKFIKCLRELGVKVETGQFQAEMLVHIDNHGPVTLMVESEPARPLA